MFLNLLLTKTKFDLRTRRAHFFTYLGDGSAVQLTIRDFFQVCAVYETSSKKIAGNTPEVLGSNHSGAIFHLPRRRLILGVQNKVY